MTNVVPNETRPDLTSNFQWGEVPSQPEEGFDVAFALVRPPLGPLEQLAGTGKLARVFAGRGFNAIFRPQNFADDPTSLPTPGTGPSDNVLELNLTEETLEFSGPLGSVPNRAFVPGQKDVKLNGIPYVQRVNDVTDPDRVVGIHFEPGVWLSVPDTQVPTEVATVVRMGSIPHGTTIEAQGRFLDVPGGPRIDPVDITPFPIGNPASRLTGVFPSQTATNADTFRIPQDLAKFIADGTITQEILDDPNVLLRRRAQAQDITATTVILIDTDPTAPSLLSAQAVDPDLFGGGTDNIAFLRGDPAGANPHADAVRMSAIFWVETVTDRITLPDIDPGGSATVRGTDSAHDGLVPRFEVTATEAVTAGTAVDVTYTQVQYTQLVLLNFATLSWPHVSVATLVPQDPIPVSVPVAP